MNVAYFGSTRRLRHRALIIRTPSSGDTGMKGGMADWRPSSACKTAVALRVMEEGLTLWDLRGLGRKVFSLGRLRGRLWAVGGGGSGSGPRGNARVMDRRLRLTCAVELYSNVVSLFLRSSMDGKWRGRGAPYKEGVTGVIGTFAGLARRATRSARACDTSSPYLTFLTLSGWIRPTKLRTSEAGNASCIGRPIRGHNNELPYYALKGGWPNRMIANASSRILNLTPGLATRQSLGDSFDIFYEDLPLQRPIFLRISR
ncbi:hypothetical protein DFP72DRAFT_846556 [Ephemerocybe angulata]|uniref:Uncharacterized protein n=1 Tax=Ephemerocybe angulata TaxID=980116 RepID=A0A8H6I3F1_9AGAR|nr:hypothetical protein DFP72DRAFT_846556 [Tulosesus angulatus]